MALGSVTTYAMVQATVRALYGELLSEATLQEMVAATDYGALLTLLSDTVYGPYLELERQLLTPRRAAYQLRKRLAAVYKKLIDITPEPGRRLILGLWRLFEVDNLKATLRGIEHDASWDHVRYLLFPMHAYTSITPQLMRQMVEADDIPAALSYLERTPYYDLLSHAVDRYRQEANLFPLEVTLDLDYRRNLWKQIFALRGKDREESRRILGTVLDLDNLLWAIRYRVYHHLSPQEIVNYTLSEGYRLRNEHILSIANGEDISAVVAEVYPEIEVPDDLSKSTGAALETLEYNFQRYIVRLCRRTFLGDPFHLGLPLAYLLLSEHEIKNLTAIIEAKAAHLPPALLGRVLDIIAISPEGEQI
ncbi:MAG: V0D/AC39 family V-type ATPase subunit [Anaerolineae bacterium]